MSVTRPIWFSDFFMQKKLLIRKIKLAESTVASKYNFKLNTDASAG
ncbi:hypothetical protein CNW10_1819 [Lactiplantibacillus plantarum]|nr:hypothetical protein LpDm1_1875 [Lactiplantibacillus plantarum]KZU15585.1 hypothetical protein CNW10_1819 [Lactiplantibacillus plantarum]